MLYKVMWSVILSSFDRQTNFVFAFLFTSFQNFLLKSKIVISHAINYKFVYTYQFDFKKVFYILNFIIIDVIAIHL